MNCHSQNALAVARFLCGHERVAWVNYPGLPGGRYHDLAQRYPMDFSGKPMKSMIYVDARGLDLDESLRSWVEPALNLVKKLPPKT